MTNNYLPKSVFFKPANFKIVAFNTQNSPDSMPNADREARISTVSIACTLFTVVNSYYRKYSLYWFVYLLDSEILTKWILPA